MDSLINENEGELTFSVATPILEDQTTKAEDSSSPSDDPAGADESNAISEEGKDPVADAEAPAQENINPTEAGTKKSPSNDPIRWFGVLVPPPLRSAQTSFITAVEGPITSLSTLLKDIRQQEIEIGRTRKQIKKL